MVYNTCMDPNSNIADFLAQAQTSGIPHTTLVGLLTSQGWTEKEIYEALAAQYRLTGLTVPRRPAAGSSAREAFFYLLLFSTLATWTVAFSLLAFELIDRWLPDPLFYANQFYTYQAETETMTSSLAALIVAFPLFLLLSNAITRTLAANPERRHSPTRKWLTYLALVIAACVFMGDLIAALSPLLRGELTSRFLAKALVVLALSAGVFTFYFGGLRHPAKPPIHNRLAATLTSALAALLVALAFFNLGSPRVQREIRTDIERANDLQQVSSEVNTYFSTHSDQLPSSVAQVESHLVDPATHASYEFHPHQGGHYELCTTFIRASEPRLRIPYPWAHPIGHHCFPLDAPLGQVLPTFRY